MAYINADGSESVAIGGVPIVPAQATLAASTNLPVPFGQQVNRVVIQNNTAAVIYRRYDAAANLGSYAIAAGASVVDQVSTGLVNLFGATGGTVNGTAVSGIVVEGYV